MPRSGVSKPHLSGPRYFPKTSIIFRGGRLAFVTSPAQGRQDSPRRSRSRKLKSLHFLWTGFATPVADLLSAPSVAASAHFRAPPVPSPPELLRTARNFGVVRFGSNPVDLLLFSESKKNKSSLNFQRTLLFTGSTGFEPVE